MARDSVVLVGVEVAPLNRARADVSVACTLSEKGLSAQFRADRICVSNIALVKLALWKATSPERVDGHRVNCILIRQHMVLQVSPPFPRHVKASPYAGEGGDVLVVIRWDGLTLVIQLHRAVIVQLVNSYGEQLHHLGENKSRMRCLRCAGKHRNFHHLPRKILIGEIACELKRLVPPHRQKLAHEWAGG
jgi:hypothetical protein